MACIKGSKKTILWQYIKQEIAIILFTWVKPEKWDMGSLENFQHCWEYLDECMVVLLYVMCCWMYYFEKIKSHNPLRK